MKPKVAIACQGGGSQTAFTAGALKALFANGVQDHFQIVSLSGTSGGAICALLVWYALKKGDETVWKRLIEFWEDNTAQTLPEKLFNDFAIKTLELTSKGLVPQFNLSPSSPWVEAWFSLTTQGLRRRFTDFRALLEAHIDFRELAAWGVRPEPPVLLMGACNILTGRLHEFNSRLEPIKIEQILASACVPNLFPAVAIENAAYWDGLFSDNPPIDSLIKQALVGAENIPDEIWVIKINPTTRDQVPAAPDDIADRRNELEGNLSLFQSLRQIEDFNNLFLAGAFREEFLASIDVKEPIKIPKSFIDDPDHNYHIPLIEMSEALAKTLNYESKLDRSPESIRRLIADGERQGQDFLNSRLASLGGG
ncbi:MAG: patatin-like phospholipase family protein [Cyanobacteria bacterium RI_101]|nr:patatin-like phospholipase family protein [Cyanobacteria bacterium RI_101]